VIVLIVPVLVFYEYNRLEAIPMMGEALQATIRKYFDNSLDNIGRGNSVSPHSGLLTVIFVESER
jgi:hypothetical protein